MQKPFTPKLRLIKTQIGRAKTKKIRVSRRVGTQESPENVILKNFSFSISAVWGSVHAIDLRTLFFRSTMTTMKI